MKRLLIILLSLISFIGFSQSLDSIKHIEIVSEIRDSMALINKSDIDVINKTFHELDCADSLNRINDSIINILSIEKHCLDSIIQTQVIIIENEEQIRNQLVTDHSVEVDHYKKELKKSNNKKIA
jgi:hypothetical protein